MSLKSACAIISLASLLALDSAAAQTFQYRRDVTLRVGESVILKGVRWDCGNRAPSWRQIAAGIPESSLGRFSDGGAGTTKSNRCNAVVGARGVRFTATKPGSETLTIYDDRIRIRVVR